jgi:hypothetical protein
LTGIVWQWRRAEHHLYVANMNVVQHRWDQNHVSRVRELLEKTATATERGFEWYYWQRQMHQELKSLRGHTGPLLAVAYSPDGQRIVTGVQPHRQRVGRGCGKLRALKGTANRSSQWRFPRWPADSHRSWDDADDRVGCDQRQRAHPERA